MNDAKDVTGLTSGWLGDVSERFRAAILDAGRWVSAPAGTAIYTQGADEQDLYGVALGVVRMHIAMNEHEQHVAHICGPGFWFGEFELTTGTPRIMEIEATVDTRLVRLTRADFLKIAENDPEAWKWIAALSAEHTGLAIGAADDLMLSSAKKRLTAVLLRLSGHRLTHPNSPPMPNTQMTQSELAVAANMSRRSASDILRSLERDGMISIKYGSIGIADPNRLSAILL